VQLTSDATDDVHPSFSPDGRHLVYCSRGSQSGQWELVVVDVEAPSTKRFIGYGLLPTWAPTGNKIVFQKSRERGSRTFSVWTVDYANGEGIRPTEIAASSNAAVITPSFSPDGNHIVFCTVVDLAADETQRPQQADIWVIGADGTGRANLTHSPFANLQPVWAKDGSIYFVSNRGSQGRENIYAVRPDRAIGVTQSATTAQRPAAKQSNDTAPGTQELTQGNVSDPAIVAAQDAPATPAAPAVTAAAPTE
jgi:TolB protein